jgi:hypothetical protein
MKREPNEDMAGKGAQRKANKNVIARDDEGSNRHGLACFGPDF